jgi:hypothetical protein
VEVSRKHLDEATRKHLVNKWKYLIIVSGSILRKHLEVSSGRKWKFLEVSARNNYEVSRKYFQDGSWKYLLIKTMKLL